VNPPAGGAECHHDDDLCGERRARSAGGPTETARSGDGGNPGGSTLSGYELVGGRIGLAGRCRLGFDPRMLIRARTALHGDDAGVEVPNRQP
jgi:hypothetical protein